MCRTLLSANNNVYECDIAGMCAWVCVHVIACTKTPVRNSRSLL